MSARAAEAETHTPGSLWRTIVALFVAGFATFSLIYSAQPLLTEFARDFRLDPATSALAVSSTTATLAVSIMAMAALSEQFGRRGLMFVSMLVAAGLNLASAGAPSWPLLLSARAMEGLVLGGVPSTAMAYLAEETPPERLGFAMGLYVSGTAFGGMTGRVAVGAIAEASSWRTALGVVSGLDLVAALIFVALLPPSRHFVRRSVDLAADLRAWGRHLAASRMRRLFLVAFVGMGAFVAVYNFIGFRLAAPPYRLGQTAIGLIFLIYLVGMAASSWAGGLADRLGRGRILALGALIALAGLGISLLQPLALVIAGVAALTAGFFMVHGVASGWVGRLAARDRAHASSLYLLAYYLGASVLGAAGGWAWRAATWPGVVAYAAALMLAVLLLAATLRNGPDPA